jgi:serpin B
MKHALILSLALSTLHAASPLAESINSFGLDLHTKLSPAPGNLFYSPFSISSALGMTAAGAAGNTSTEMRTTLHFQGDIPEQFLVLNKRLHENAEKSGQSLRIANGLCLVEGNVAADYKTLLREKFSAEIFSGDLAKVNAWVKEKTNGKIPKLLEAFPANTVCVILNAIYFKGDWAAAFDKDVTHEASFSVTSDKTVKAMMMFRKGNYRWIADKDLQVLELPYKGEALSMLVFLPQTIDGLPALEKQLTPEVLNGWSEKLGQQRPREIDVFFPRFTLETEYDLNLPLQSLGMKDAFDSDNADFSGMGWSKGDLWIGQVKHKAFIQVNEEGTEAAAATAVIMVTRMAMVETPVFRADHPFFFVIRDNATNTLLFSGRLVNPGP